MTDPHPMVQEHWPHLAELVRTLGGLGNVKTAAPTSDRDLDEKIATAVARWQRHNGR